MAEEKRLIATIVPRFDEAALAGAISRAFQQAIDVNVNINHSGGNVVPSPGFLPPGDTAQVDAGNVSEAVNSMNRTAAKVTQLTQLTQKAMQDAKVSADAGDTAQVDAGNVSGQSDEMRSLRNSLANIQTRHRFDATSQKLFDIIQNSKVSSRLFKDAKKEDAEMEKDEKKRNERRLQMISGAAQQFSHMGISLMKNTFGILEDIYQRMKASSPLLQSVESLFNLAMQLFFMPLGNKLAEEILPATLDLVDAVVDMWDAFDDMSLTEMFVYAIEHGVQLLSDYFQDIGGLLQDQGGLLGSIGDLFVSFGNFIENNGVKVLEAILKITDLVISHLGTIIALVGAFYGFYIGYTMAKDALGFLGWFPGMTTLYGTLGGLIGAGVGGLVGAGAASWVGLPFAKGGHVDATPGGVPAIVGEGGEGEWIIPDSKMGSVGNTYNIHITGMTNDELKAYINDVVNQQISQSRLRSGFRWGSPRHTSSSAVPAGR